MDSKERFLRIMNYQSVDRMMVWDFYYWPETLVRWKKEGLPESIDDPSEFLNIDKRWRLLEVKTGPFPSFEEKILREEKEFVIIQDNWGRVCKKARSKEQSVFPQFIKFPVQNREDFKVYQKKLNPKDPGRFPKNWMEIIKKHKNRDYPLGYHNDGLFGFTRELMGLENLCIALYEDPNFIEEIMEYQTYFCIEYAKSFIKEINFDFIIFWEDMAFNKASLISPHFVEKFMLPRYKKIMDFAHQNGIDLAWVDSDGTIKEIIPIWLKAGINIIFPAEQGTCDNNISEWRKRYGRSLRIIGGIDKFEVSKGKEAIKNQIKKNINIIKEGGFIPILDHSVPPNVSLSDYQYYLELIRNIE